MTVRLTFFILTFVTIALVHMVSMEFYLYWRYAWLDIPMHFLGGVMCALGFSVLPFFRVQLPSRYTTFLHYLVFVLCMGIVWELYEYSFGIMGEGNLVIDTSMDIMLDLVGGVIGYGIAHSSDNI